MIVATYSFTDEDGALVAEKVRKHPKAFAWRRPDGNGGWIWNRQGIDLPLYRLPEVIEAARDGRVILEVESEKDADTAAAHGFVATCGPDGGGKAWSRENMTHLRGCHLVIVPHNDEVGQKHAKKLARAACGVAASVRILSPLSDAPGGDLTDFFDEGGTSERLREIIRQTPAWEPEQEARPEPRPLKLYRDRVADERKRAYADKALATMVDELASMKRSTGRNNALNEAAFKAGRFAADGTLDERDIRDGLTSACHLNGLVDDDTLASVTATIRSGLEAGLLEPFDWSAIGHDRHDDRHNGRDGVRKNGVSVLESASRRHDPLGTVTRDDEGEPKATPLWGFDKPDPLGWLVDRFLPEGFVTLLAADGGTGKSYLALLLAIMVVLGRDFLGLPTKCSRVLYVDYELDADEQKRRVWRVLAGLGMTPDDPRLEGRFFYYRPTRPLSMSEGHDEVVALIEKHDVGLTVLDSLTIGLGADATLQRDVTPIMQSFKRWGTVLAIDHVSGASARGNASKARPFGSVFKRNVARSTFTLAKVDGGGHLLTADKSNFAAPQDLIAYSLDFADEGEVVTFQRLDHTDEAMAGALAHMSTYDVTLTAILEVYRDERRPVTITDVIEWRDKHDEAGPIKEGTAKNHLVVLRRRGKITDEDNGVVPCRDDRHDLLPRTVRSETKNGEIRPETTSRRHDPYRWSDRDDEAEIVIPLDVYRSPVAAPF